MIGHEKIIELRRGGAKPRIVVVNDYPCDCARDWHRHGDNATVSTSGDVVQLLDMRFLVGLTVSISADSEVRAKALFEKAKASGASVVAACHVKRDEWAMLVHTGWSAVWKRSEEVCHG